MTTRLIRRVFPVALGLGVIACGEPGGIAAPTDAGPPAVVDAGPPEPEGVWAVGEPSFEDRYKPVVLLYRGRGPGEDAAPAEGFELVVGGERLDLNHVRSIVVTLPGELGDRTLRRSEALTGLPATEYDFFGYYGTDEGLPPMGDYAFRFHMRRGEERTLFRHVDLQPIEVPEGLVVERSEGRLDVHWSAVGGARNYSAVLFESDATGATLTDTGIGCQTGVTASPPDGSRPLPTPGCVIDDSQHRLEEGGWYVVSLGAWGWEEPEGVSSFSGSHSEPFRW